MRRLFAGSTLATICFALTSGCSQAGEAPDRRETATPAAVNPAVVGNIAVVRPEAPAADQVAESRVLGKKDITLRGKPACEVRFVYAGREAEDLFWEEPCSAVTAKMTTEQELKSIGNWDRLDSFAHKFVRALPGGKVLYIEGGFSASVYPVGTTGSTYEVPVAD